MKVLNTGVTRPEKPIGCVHGVSDASTLLDYYALKINLEEEIFTAQKGIRQMKLLKNPKKVKNVYS